MDFPLMETKRRCSKCNQIMKVSKAHLSFVRIYDFVELSREFICPSCYHEEAEFRAFPFNPSVRCCK